jgi:phage/plasmid-associated DNA primase
MYYKEGAIPPQAVQQATAEYRKNSDKIGNFISECLTMTGRNTKALDVYIKYKEWCSNNGFGVENKGNFFDELRGKNIFAPSGTINGVTVRNVIKDYVLIRDEIEERPPYYSYSSRKSDRNYYD